MDPGIEDLNRQIRKVEQQIDAVEELTEAATGKEKLLLRKEKLLLRKEKEQLREKELLLLKAANPEGGSPPKRPRSHRRLQSFVQSAREHYKEWEEADAASFKKDCGMSFLRLSVDPFSNFLQGLLLWIREYYKDLRNILVEAKEQERFIVMGTSGIGKSYFSVFWICYLATKKETIVWKLRNEFHLLDFSDEASSAENEKATNAYGPLEVSDPEVQKVFQNPAAWLIIDGEQKLDILCDCHILLPCSADKDNYKEFAKGLLVTTLYMPVWEEEEIRKCLDAFDGYRPKYSSMDVPFKEEAMKSFEELGGVPRYVLCFRHIKERLVVLSAALNELEKDTCLDFLAGSFDEVVKRDALVHIKYGRSMDEKYGKYKSRSYILASNTVILKLKECFVKVSKISVVRFLTANAQNPDIGNVYGHIFELVAHALVMRGGEYRMKRVMKGGGAEEVDPLKLSDKMRVATFASWKEFPRFEADTYYMPKCRNLKSIDALLHPNLLLQYFSYNQGDHGYLVQGLLDAHAALKLPKYYKVCSCVPKDKYDQTGWQPWNTIRGTRYVQQLPQVIEDSEQYVIEVDFEAFSSQSAVL